MDHTNESATQGAAEQTVTATEGLTAKHYLSCQPYA